MREGPPLSSRPRPYLGVPTVPTEVPTRSSRMAMSSMVVVWVLAIVRSLSDEGLGSWGEIRLGTQMLLGLRRQAVHAIEGWRRLDSSSRPRFLPASGDHWAGLPAGVQGIVSLRAMVGSFIEKSRFNSDIRESV